METKSRCEDTSYSMLICGINSSSTGRKLVVSESLPENVLRDPPSQTIRPISPFTTTSSSSNSRCNSPTVRVEQIAPGKWTHISGRVSIRPLTRSETASVFEKQRRNRYKRSRKKERFKMEEHDDTRSTIEVGSIHIPSSDGKEIIPESPGSRSNYGEFYW
uniref:Uncharacterized protein n=1 Tax=Heterorhabditis bacteriophora TaxID=37862 RepID=A0A1I7XQ50_HETBA